MMRARSEKLKIDYPLLTVVSSVQESSVNLRRTAIQLCASLFVSLYGMWTEQFMHRWAALNCISCTYFPMCWYLSRSDVFIDKTVRQMNIKRAPTLKIYNIPLSSLLTVIVLMRPHKQQRDVLKPFMEKCVRSSKIVLRCILCWYMLWILCACFFEKKKADGDKNATWTSTAPA